MSLYTCPEHDDIVVVYQGSRSTKCPLCEANGTIESMADDIDNLTGEVESLKEEIGEKRE